MADIKQAEVDIPVIAQAIEQKFAENIGVTGVAPELGGEAFDPYHETADGVIRYKQHDDPAIVEADAGGLFTLAHKQPGILEQVLMDLGDVEAYTVSIVTSAGEWEVDSGTAQYVVLLPRILIMPGENVKITAATPGAGKKSWMRIYVRSDQARH